MYFVSNAIALILQKQAHLNPPHTPDIFNNDSFNETDPFLADLDIAEIEKQASQGQSSCENKKLKQSSHTTSVIELTHLHKSSQSKLPIAAQSSLAVNSLPSPIRCESDSDDIFLAKMDVTVQKHTQSDNITRSSNQTTPLSEHCDIFLPVDKKQLTVKESCVQEKETLSRMPLSMLSDINRTTPASGSLVKRLKRTLLKNATTPQGRARLQQGQKDQMENALKDAKTIQVKGLNICHMYNIHNLNGYIYSKYII